MLGISKIVVSRGIQDLFSLTHSLLIYITRNPIEYFFCCVQLCIKILNINKKMLNTLKCYILFLWFNGLLFLTEMNLTFFCFGRQMDFFIIFIIFLLKVTKKVVFEVLRGFLLLFFIVHLEAIIGSNRWIKWNFRFRWQVEN